MGLQQQLDAFRAEAARTAPAERVALFNAKIEELRGSFASENALGIGDRVEDFILTGAHGKPVSLSALLSQGPVILTFYRGGWCPYCNLQLQAYQAALPDFAALGARLVAISPQLPDGSLSTAEKNALTFDVVSDTNNAVARKFGLVYALPEELRQVYRSINKALPGLNGDDSWELPVPATYVIAPDGRVALAYLDVDYRRRLPPEDISAALSALKTAAA